MVTAATVAVLLATLSVTLFGDNLRRHFAMSADSLAGNNEVGQANPLLRKKMLNFGTNNSYGEATAVIPTPTGNTQEAVAPNPWTASKADHLSTFAIDVDTASYTIARRTLNAGQLPVQAGVRIEEWVNAFQYKLEQPKDLPFSVGVEGAPSPFTPDRTLLKVSVQGRKVNNRDRKPAHLVFLVDTSGSMGGADRLGLAQESLRILTRNLNPRDTVALVTYAGDVRDVLAPTPAENREQILEAIDSLTSGGGTAMGSGIELAYRHAAKMVAPGHVSRVLVLTDGDANIGTVGTSAILDSVAQYVKQGVTLTTVGFGMGNYRDSALEQLADKGNGQSVYIDTRAEAQKVFGERLSGTLELIAKDVKVQVDFDSKVVQEYRLLGYENRAVADEDFRNDKVDGGEIGAGHSVTALYELTLARPSTALGLNDHGSFGTVYVRGMKPEGTEAFEVRTLVGEEAVHAKLADASTELRFAAAVAVAADILRGNPASADWNLARVQQLALNASNGIPERLEFVQLLEKALELKRIDVAARN